MLCSVTLVDAATTVNCYNLDQEDSAEVVKQPCDSLTSQSGYNLTVKDVDDTKWTGFTCSLLGITNVAVIIEDSSIDKLNLPALDKISSAKRGGKRY